MAIPQPPLQPLPDEHNPNRRAAAIQQFIASWEQLGGTWEQHANPISARLALLLRLREMSVSEVMSWQPSRLPVPALAETFGDAGLSLILPDTRNPDARLGVGLIAADAALSATGSLILLPEPDRSLLPALLPIRLFVLLPAVRIYPDLDVWRQAWQQAGRSSDIARSFIITGPSVSDVIELHPHRGMFGPRYLHVFLIEQEQT